MEHALSCKSFPSSSFLSTSKRFPLLTCFKTTHQETKQSKRLKRFTRSLKIRAPPRNWLTILRGRFRPKKRMFRFVRPLAQSNIVSHPGTAFSSHFCTRWLASLLSSCSRLWFSSICNRAVNLTFQSSKLFNSSTALTFWYHVSLEFPCNISDKSEP